MCRQPRGAIGRGGTIDLDLTISRLRPLLCGVKVRGSFGVLFVPTTPAPAPILYRESGAFRLRPVEAELEATDAAGCFLLAHWDFAAVTRDPSRRTHTDAARFSLLIATLESLRIA